MNPSRCPCYSLTKIWKFLFRLRNPPSIHNPPSVVASSTHVFQPDRRGCNAASSHMHSSSIPPTCLQLLISDRPSTLPRETWGAGSEPKAGTDTECPIMHESEAQGSVQVTVNATLFSVRKAIYVGQLVLLLRCSVSWRYVSAA